MNLKKKFNSQFLILLMFVFYMCYTIINNFATQIVKINEYKSEIEYLNKSIIETKKEIEKYNEKEDYDLEQIARERLNMVKSNEIIYMDIKER
ncbi:MAG: septum formation initiator family protein [Peptostreptococcaceae bacterium]